MRIIYLIISAILVLVGQTAHSQVTVVPASSSCNCNGSFTYSPYPGSPTTFQVQDFSSSVILNAGNPNGSLTMNNLCGSIFLVTATSPLGSTQAFIQVNAIGAGIGTANTANICSTSGSVNLTTFLGAFSAGGIWRRPNGTTFNGVYNPLVENGGIYSYSQSIAGCIVTTGVLVNEIQNANAGLQTTILICDTYNTFFMTDFLNGNPDYGGTWLNASGNTVSGFFNPATTPSSTFVYMIDNVPGCNPVFNTLVIDVNVTPDAGGDANLIVCDNATPFDLFNQLGGTPDNNGTWYGPNNTPTDNIFDPATDVLGVYRYVVSALVPCQTQEAEVNIAYTPNDPSGEPSSLTVCANGPSFDMTAALNGSPSSGGVWRNAANQVVSNIYNPLTAQPGIYNYLFPNIGCSQTGAQLTIQEELPPNAGSDVTIELCQSSTPLNLVSLVNGGSNTGNFFDLTQNSFSNLTDISFSQLISLTYEVAGVFCPTDIANFTIGIVSPPNTPQDISLEYCTIDNSIDLNSYYPGIAFPEWSDANGNIVSSIFDPATGSTQNLTITSLSNNACPNIQAQAEITVNAPFFADQNYSVNVCITDTPFELDPFLTNGEMGLGQWWNQLGGAVATPVPISTPGQYDFNYISNDNGSCPDNIVTLELNVSDSINAGLDSSIEICGDDELLNLNDLLSNSIDQTGLWYFGTNALANSIIDPALLNSGIYIYQLPANIGCPLDESEHLVTIRTPIIAEAGNALPICSGEAPIAIGASELPGVNYIWYPSNNLSNINASSPTVSIENNTLQPISQEYFVSIDDGICNDIDSITVVINPLPIVQLADGIELCLGDEITLNASGNYNFTWGPSLLFPNNNLPTQTIAPTNDATIFLQATNPFNCTISATANITVHPLPELYYEWEFQESCTPFELELNPYLDHEYFESGQWYLSNELISDNDSLSYIINEAGTYDLIFVAQSEEGCEASWEFSQAITVHPYPISNFSWSPENPTLIQNEVEFENMSIDAASYEWSFGDGETSTLENPTHEFISEEAEYFEVCLETASSFGCLDTICKSIYIENDYVFFAPNSFTPNNDGLNDVFKPILSGFENSTYELIITDRWGTVVYKSNDVEQGWMGDVRGGENYAMDGVYTWQVKVKIDLIADYRVYSGHVLMIR
ncbi:MAG: gliding motility-associated C-terminal domain-containing protein [Flavobacteriales bacterium]